MEVGGTSQLPLNTWSHLAATSDGTTLKLFVNGVQVGSSPVSGAMHASTNVVRIGGNSIWSSFFQGRIDEVRIFNLPRTAAQISADMNSAVVSVGSPPTLTNPGNQSNAENDVVSLALAATDPDGDPISYSATGLPPSLTVNASTGFISGTLSYSSAGSHTVVVTATATGGSDSKTFTWTVTNTDRLPTLVNPDNRTNAENAAISLALSATDADGEAITYSATGLPPSLTVNAATGLISGTLSYTSAGSHTVVVTATAGGASDSETFTWTVTNTNRPPVVTSPGIQAGTQGTPVSLAVTATDPDATALTFSAAGLPTGLSIQASTGVISGTPTATGVFATTVTVSDGTATASASFSWTISLVVPGAATLIAPTGTIATPTPTFSWMPVSGATHYQLWVNDAITAAKITTTYPAAAVGCGATGTCTISPGVTLASGAATWWIRTTNAAGDGTWSTAVAITVPGLSDTTAPIVALTSPTSSATYTATSGTLAVGGTAGDNLGVTQVAWSTNRGGSGVATGTTAWTIAAVPIASGTTVITVTARDAANNAASDTLTVTYNAAAPPGAATLVAPTGTISTATPSFSWMAVSGATHYQLWVNDANTGAKITTIYPAAAVGCGGGTGTCAVSPGVTLASGAATWWILTSNAAGSGPWSTASSFVVSAGTLTPPGAATPVAPAGTISTATPSFSWLAASGATHYLLFVNDASTGAKINIVYPAAAAGCGGGTGTCAVSPGVTLASGAATWWILTSNAAGNGPWSTASSFVVSAGTLTPPGAVTLVAPTGTISTATPSFSWLAVSGATHYLLFVNDASTRAKINVIYSAAAVGCGGGTGTCTASPGVTLAPGAATWWILTSNAAGTEAWSSSGAFMVP